MALSDRVREAVKSLLGVSTYEIRPGHGYDLEDNVVETIRQALGGQLQPIPTTHLRWYRADLETAQHEADAGNLTKAARLHNAMRGDGFLTGLANTRSDGLVRLPKLFYSGKGGEELAAELRSQEGNRSVFDELVPPSELAAIDWDGIDLGVGVGELVPVDGRDYPVLCRLDPEFLTYRWSENRWYFSSIAGVLPITPGDGRWVLHTPGGRIAPWRSGIWRSNARSYIDKDHALQHRANYSAKLANPARVATAPMGASQPERVGMLRMIMAWAVNSVFEMPPGWDVKLLETKGEGWKVFQEEIDTCNKELMVNIAGQEVTTTGGSGFSNQDVQKIIRQDLIAADAERLAYTVNTQILPAHAVLRGVDIAARAWMMWSIGSPKDLKAEGDTLQSVAQAIVLLLQSFAAAKREVDLDALAERFAIPLRKAEQGAPAGAVQPLERSEQATPEGQEAAGRVLEQAA